MTFVVATHICCYLQNIEFVYQKYEFFLLVNLFSWHYECDKNKLIFIYDFIKLLCIFSFNFDNENNIKTK